MTIPYTYRVIHQPSGTWYYGVRYAKGCHPSDLFKSYFTSSVLISKLLKEDGPDSFHIEVRRIFETAELAIDWESRVLRKILGWQKVLNQSAFPAILPEARSRGNRKKAEVQESGMTIFQQAGKKWKEKKNDIDPETGLTHAELRKQRFNASLDKNQTRFVKGDIKGGKNPAKRKEVREKISTTLKERIASGEIVPWPTGKKLEYASKLMIDNNLAGGMLWYNDGNKDYRLKPDDPRARVLSEGRLFSAIRGKKYESVKCPHCGTVGGGGNGSTTAAAGATGSNSVFGSFTASGGGGGSGYQTAGASGGSGGGGGRSDLTNGGVGGSGISGQGNSGGNGLGSSNNASGGGGGAGTVGLPAVTAGYGGNGGAGIASSISGTVTTYAGGGGAFGATGGAATGGAGGGGTGANGTANTGGGGAGGGSGTGYNGGSGIVIIRYPDTFRAATSTTGSPTITVAGGFRVYKFTASGSITF